VGRQNEGSFGFAKRWLLCRAKPNVPECGRVFYFLFCLFAANLRLSFFFQLAPNVLFTQQIYNIRKYNVKFHKVVDKNLDFYSVVEITILFLKMQAFWIKISYFNVNHGSALLTIGFSTA